MRNDERERMDREARNIDRTTREVVEGKERLTLSEEELALRKQAHLAGEVDVRKTVETEHVRESVPLSHEEVIVERHAVTPGMHATGRIDGEEEIRVPVSRETVSASKRVVPKEELVVKKREVVENEVVDADLRRERAEISRQGDVEIREDGFRADDARTGRDRI